MLEVRVFIFISIFTWVFYHKVDFLNIYYKFYQKLKTLVARSWPGSKHKTSTKFSTPWANRFTSPPRKVTVVRDNVAVHSGRGRYLYFRSVSITHVKLYQKHTKWVKPPLLDLSRWQSWIIIAAKWPASNDHLIVHVAAVHVIFVVYKKLKSFLMGQSVSVVLIYHLVDWASKNY